MRVTATSYEPVEDRESLGWGRKSSRASQRGRCRAASQYRRDRARRFPFAGRKWDHICFMFPHIAGKGRISLNRELLAGSFRAATAVLAPGVRLKSHLLPGRAGPPRMVTHVESTETHGRLQFKRRKEGSVLIDTAHFDAEAWESRGYRSRGHWRGALTAGEIFPGERWRRSSLSS